MGTLASTGAVIFGSVEVLKFMFPAATGDAPQQFKTTFTFQELTGGVDGSGKAKAGATVRSITTDRVSVVVDDAGIYAVFLGWPAEGDWIVNLKGTCADAKAGALVPIGPKGFIREASKFFPRPATDAEIETSLKALRQRGKK